MSASHLPRLVLTVGLPYSGKSTWARQQGYPIVCPDAIRLAIHGHRYIPRAEGMVWSIAKVMVRALFEAGHPVVILDATSVSRRRRDEWKSEDWETRFKLIDTPPVVCIRRADEAEDERIVPVIKRMWEEAEPLGEDEQEWPS